MNKKTLTKLEYHKIIDILIEQATSFGGKERCKRLKPMTSLPDINTAQEQTAAAFTRIIRKGRPSFGSCNPVGESLKRLEVGAALGSGELLRICKLLENAGQIKAYGRHETVDDAEDCLDIFFQQIEPLTLISTEIRRCIIDEDEISDDASSTLKQIRRSMNQINDKVHSTLSSLVNGSLRTYLQDSIITMRGDRYCIPVKAEYRSQVSGLIHDQSATGSTLFIEPMSVVKLNNDLKELYGKEQEEIQIILARLSADVAEYTESIRTDYKIMTELDFIFARGNLAILMNASKPVFNTKGKIHIREGRHPLLDKKKVVPITVTLGDTFDLLIVTGPNTGGKTVSLKTVGLFTLMGQAGLHIPALDRSELALFENVYADIGDEQSIEQSLSTFSSHMTNIVSFLKHVDEHSLVLFDELNAGTDPTEGAALAIAILSYLHQRGIRTMATTHYSELKVFALSTPGVENACCEFDVETLSPTYRLLIGIPGKSNAFAISKKLGLSDEILDRAKSFQKDDDINIETLLKNIYDDKLAIEEEKEKIRKNSSQVELLRKSLERDNSKLTQEAENIVSDAKQKAREILLDAKDEANEIIRELNKESTNTKSANVLRNKLNSSIDTLSHIETNNSVSNSKSLSSEDITVGMEVMCKNFNAKGTVLSLPNRSNEVRVQIGALTTNVKLSDLLLLNTSKKSSTKQSGSTHKNSNVTFSNNKAQNVASEINVIGLTVDQALPIVDKYLDDCYIANLENARIVHGKGTGRLRDGIHSFLKKNPHVKSYRMGTYGEGEMGVTVVSFK